MSLSAIRPMIRTFSSKPHDQELMEAIHSYNDRKILDLLEKRKRSPVQPSAKSTQSHAEELLKAIDSGNDRRILDLIQKQKGISSGLSEGSTQRSFNFSSRFKPLHGSAFRDVCFFLLGAGSFGGLTYASLVFKKV